MCSTHLGTYSRRTSPSLAKRLVLGLELEELRHGDRGNGGTGTRLGQNRLFRHYHEWRFLHVSHWNRSAQDHAWTTADCLPSRLRPADDPRKV